MDDDRDFWSVDDWGEFDGDNAPPSDDLSEADDGSPTMEQIIASLGRESITDFIVNLKDVEDASTIRAERFHNLGDALFWLYEIGVAGFSDIVEIEFNVYAVSVPDDTP